LKLLHELEQLKAQEAFALTGGAPAAFNAAATVDDYGFKSDGFDDSSFGFGMAHSASTSNFEDMTRSFFRSESSTHCEFLECTLGLNVSSKLHSLRVAL